MTPWRLVADIGGSNVRLARSHDSGRLTHVVSHPTSRFASFLDALEAYLSATGGSESCTSAALGAAGPVEGCSVTLTNKAAWKITGPQVSAALEDAPVVLVNDLEAVAAALPHLGIDDTEPIGTPKPEVPATRPMLALNIGTGLGAALATCHAGRWWTQPGEAGHMTLAGNSDLERQLIEPSATVESFLSGAGITRAYVRLNGVGDAHDAAQVLARAARDDNAARVLHAATDILGRIAGDLVLATGAWGGVHLCGSVAEGLLAHADRARLRTAFENKGPMQERLQRTPMTVIRRENVALYGLAMLAIEA